jgi:hypothetical protein
MQQSKTKTYSTVLWSMPVTTYKNKDNTKAMAFCAKVTLPTGDDICLELSVHPEMPSHEVAIVACG